jgi:class 3 adenylate cyclase
MTNQALQRLQRAAWSTRRGKVSVSAADLSALIYAWAKLQERDQAIGFKSAISKPNLTQ